MKFILSALFVFLIFDSEAQRVTETYSYKVDFEYDYGVEKLYGRTYGIVPFFYPFKADLNNLENGFYVCKVQTDTGEIETHKIIKR